MFQQISNLFFPKVCVACTSFLLENEDVICTNCRHNLPQTKHFLEPNNEVYKRFFGRIPVEMAMSLLYFEKKSLTKNLIHQLKYKGRQEIGSTLANWFTADIKLVENIKNIDQIIPVPLHKKRLDERGYNQITAFCKTLSNNLNINLNENLLVRNVYAKTQSQKKFLERNTTNTDIFDVNFAPENHNKHYLIIDDVFTTGATLELCSKAILKIPGAKISFLTIAMAH